MKLLVATEMIGGDPTELEARPPRNAPARPKLRNFHTTWAITGLALFEKCAARREAVLN